MFALSQNDGRLPINGQMHKYPFKEVLNFANVSVFRINKSDGYLKKFDKSAVEFISPVKRERENAGRLNLKAGQTYVIIPSCETPETTGDLFMSIYLNCALRDVMIKRVFHHLDSNTAKDNILPFLIPEEAEKVASQTPPWKLELVRESLQYMITDEDKQVKEEALNNAAPQKLKKAMT